MFNSHNILHRALSWDLGDVWNTGYSLLTSGPSLILLHQKIEQWNPKKSTPKIIVQNLDFIPMGNGRKKQMCKKCYRIRIPSRILWRRKSKQVRKASLLELQCKLLADWGLINCELLHIFTAQGSFFCGIHLPSVSPVFAPKFSSQNIYTEKPPICPRAPSDRSAHRGSPSGNKRSERYGAPSPKHEDREQTQYWCTFIKLCTSAAINGAALWLKCNRMPALARPH